MSKPTPALVCFAITAALTTCRGRDATSPPVASTLARVSGQGQMGPVGQALPEPLVVAAQTAAGAGVAGVSVLWSVTAGGGSVSAIFTTTDAQGQASVILTLGTGTGAEVDSVTATVAGLAGSPVIFTASATAGAPARLVRVSGDNQTGLVGDTLAQRLLVGAQDQFGNPTGGVAVAWAVTAGGGGVSSASVTTDAQGLAAVVWTLGHQAGNANNSATASAPGLAGSPVGFTANATPDSPSQLAIVSGNNQSDTVGQALPQPLVVQARDQFDNPVPGTLVHWSVTPGDGTLSASSGISDALGEVAVVWTLGPATGAQSAAASLASGGATLAAFAATALPGPPSRLAFTVQPTTTTAGSAISPSIEVTAQDAFGNAAREFSDTVRIAFGTNPGGGALSGTSAIAAAAGVATFSDLSIDKAGAGYTLSVSATGLAGATSDPFEVTVGSLSHIAFTVQPDNTTAGAAIAPAIEVSALDDLGNMVTSFAENVTLAIGANPGNGALSGTITAKAMNGVATFDDLSIDRTGTGYTLIATTDGLAPTTSLIFDISPGAAARLAFTVQPIGVETGAAITPPVEVTARDALGNTATDFTETVTVAIAANPGGGTLSGSTSIAAAAGVVMFADLRIDQGGTGYTLRAASGALTPDTSATFDVTAPPPAGSVTVAAGDAQTGLAGFALNIPPSVLVRDGVNAPIAGASVSFVVATGGGGVTGGSATTDANGIATVGSWTVQLGSNTLTATVGGSGITGNPVTFTAQGVAAAYHIDVRFLTPTSQSRQAAFTDAAAKWETLIFGDVPDVPVIAPPDVCGSNSPALNETIDDIVIFATVDSIDGPGKILGQAGPCGVRGSGLPFLGAMIFDSADVAQLEADGELGFVILHEMGHVLGYGTVWDLLGLLQGGGGSDPHFVGAQAIAAFDRSGGESYSAGAKVPVENCVGFPPGTCGSGTRDAHWRESVFDNELMTGFLNSGAPNPLSVITTASMGDLGYLVNFAGSDPYTVVNPLTAVRAPGGRLLELPDDILRIPVFEVDVAGHIMNVRPPR